MSQSQQEAQKAVYDALCVVLGEISDNASKTKLRARIQDHAAEPRLADVIQAYGLVNVKKTAVLLYQRDVFSSKTIAQEYFQAATEVAEGSPDAAPQDPAPADEEIQLSAETRVPLSAQHHLLAKVQFELEAACFEFARAKTPAILEQNGWTCVEAVELNLIAKALGKHQEHLPGVAGLPKGVTAGKLLGAMESIRHAAVHREYLKATELLAMLRYGESLLIMLENESRLASMRSLREEVSKCIFELDGDETDVKESIATAHKIAAIQIARLKQQEDEAVVRAEARRAALLCSYAQQITAMVSTIHVKEATQIRQPSSMAALSTVLFFLARSMRSAIMFVLDILCRLYAVLAGVFVRVSV
ncbi:uncharacterized protein LMH87_007550 [Akanthomyces muscarius]|uniref:Uncharacterized protein n=1 Tax=Akanthomyces muscarius TaxID=2231603 RepID=A0A9W8QLV2_AKAMU|nr:uncharacterized protein LMH87_007550 [Akanthomyces muscarius]KAJ4161512.1 hypothetical protein LMH87_007550 [Akanthomyces muscarius]